VSQLNKTILKSVKKANSVLCVNEETEIFKCEKANVLITFEINNEFKEIAKKAKIPAKEKKVVIDCLKLFLSYWSDFNEDFTFMIFKDFRVGRFKKSLNSYLTKIRDILEGYEFDSIKALVPKIVLNKDKMNKMTKKTGIEKINFLNVADENRNGTSEDHPICIRLAYWYIVLNRCFSFLKKSRENCDDEGGIQKERLSTRYDDIGAFYKIYKESYVKIRSLSVLIEQVATLICATFGVDRTSLCKLGPNKSNPHLEKFQNFYKNISKNFKELEIVHVKLTTGLKHGVAGENLTVAQSTNILLEELRVDIITVARMISKPISYEVIKKTLKTIEQKKYKDKVEKQVNDLTKVTGRDGNKKTTALTDHLAIQQAGLELQKAADEIDSVYKDMKHTYDMLKGLAMRRLTAMFIHSLNRILGVLKKAAIPTLLIYTIVQKLLPTLLVV
jgi:hypothetical protein